MDKHYRHSTFREKLIEHLFVGELLKASWRSGECSLEVAKPEVDNHGHDLILECDGVIRHVQLKASHRNAAARSQKVHVDLAKKPSGCVLWVQFDEETLELGPYLFYGGAPWERLPALEGMKTARHTKANKDGIKAERPDLRIVPMARFELLSDIESVFVRLFGTRDGDGSLRTIEARFHDLIRTRMSEFSVHFDLSLPAIARLAAEPENPQWFPVPGMYGGFSWWWQERGQELISESWCRVIAGSGQRHAIRADSVVLLEAGFV